MVSLMTPDALNCLADRMLQKSRAFAGVLA
jgi:hypothetical protein